MKNQKQIKTVSIIKNTRGGGNPSLVFCTQNSIFDSITTVFAQV